MIRSLLLIVSICASSWMIAQCPAFTVILYDTDFEDGPGILSASGHPSWEHGVIGSTNWTGANCGSSSTPPTAAVSGTQGWGTKLNDCYDNSADTSTVGFTMDLSDPSLLSASLQFRSFYDIFTNWDYIFITVNGVQVYLNNTTDNSPGWIAQEVDLTQFLGSQAVEIEFHLYATTVVNRAGWYIDDLQVIVCSTDINTSIAATADQQQLRIWPNPSNGEVNVLPAANGGDVHHWRLLDSHGREVRNGGMLPAGSMSVLDLHGPAGLYVLEITGANGLARQRIVLH